MKCRKCRKEMFLLTKAKAFIEALVDGSPAIQKMDWQVIPCEHCEQPYFFMVKKGGKLTVSMLTPQWLSKQSKEIRANVRLAVKEVKKGLKMMRLNEYWLNRMGAIKP